jgi:chromosome segregation ATPase
LTETDGELHEALQERDAALAQRDRIHRHNDELAAQLEPLAAEVVRLRAELATLEAGSRAAAAVLSERERLRAVLRPTPQNCAVVLAAWKGDDKGSGEERAVRVLEALAAAAGMGAEPE